VQKEQGRNDRDKLMEGKTGSSDLW